MTEVHEVRVAGIVVGVAGYHTVSDILGEEIYATRDDLHAGYDKRSGEAHCVRPPYGENPHPMVWADLHELRGGVADESNPSRYLYCSFCRCLVTPPHDGYAYGDYPAEWLPDGG